MIGGCFSIGGLGLVVSPQLRPVVSVPVSLVYAKWGHRCSSHCLPAQTRALYRWYPFPTPSFNITTTTAWVTSVRVVLLTSFLRLALFAICREPGSVLSATFSVLHAQ